MEKIPTLFVRNEETHRIEPLLTPGCEWVLAGEGRPTRKVDGAAVLVRHGRCFKRREVKPGRRPPDGFQEVEADETTGKRVGWVPIRPGDPADRYFVEGINNARCELGPESADGRTFELVGPRVQRNTEGLGRHEIIPHDSSELHLDKTAVGIDGLEPDEAFERLNEYLEAAPHEGIVWHHPDGRRAKVKRRDFGHRWPID